VETESNRPDSRLIEPSVSSNKYFSKKLSSCRIDGISYWFTANMVTSNCIVPNLLFIHIYFKKNNFLAIASIINCNIIYANYSLPALQLLVKRHNNGLAAVEDLQGLGQTTAWTPSFYVG
jgi:hypothetical protein